MKKLKSTIYPLSIAVLLLVLASVGLGWLQLTVWVEPQSPAISSLPVVESPIVPAVQPVKKLSPALPTQSPMLPSPVTSPTQKPDHSAIAAHQGALRVSNPTEHTVRVALLPQTSAKQGYGEAAHWDFAPMEGSSKGLMLSLPQGNLKLSKGDILVAFAQDGSRQYWGPYVVGETSAPAWNEKTGEWLLVLQP